MLGFKRILKYPKIGLGLFIFTLVGGAINHGALAQTNIGDYQSGFEQSGNTFHFTNANADVRIRFCTSDMVRVRTSWDRTFEEKNSLMVVQNNWDELDLEAEEQPDKFILQSDQLKVEVQKSPFLIDIYDSEGNVLLSESGGNQANNGGFKAGDTVYSRKKLGADEHFFGFGERMDFMDRRGKKVNLNVGRGIGRPHIVGAYNILDANYCPIPFFMSTRGYGIFFRNAYPTEWDMGSSDINNYSFKAQGGELDYYVMHGPKFPDILDNYTKVTGKSPMVPKYAMGLHVGTYSGGTWGHEEKTSTQYVIELIRRFRALGIPIDLLHLDSTWRIFGDEGGKGATTFDWRETFDNPEAMFDTLYDLNLNMVGLHVRPRFDNSKKVNILDQARQKGHVYPEEDGKGEFVNFFDDEAVDWWWENGVMRIASIGTKFLKIDEGSAFGHKANESNKVGPTGNNIARLHNLFPLAYAKAPYEKFQEYNDMRGMNMSREGYAGIQRYPYIFAGDWPSEWQYFEPVIKGGLNIGMSGVGYWTHCMGGFEHDADPELYIRWCQFGMFSPVAHLFGMDHPGYKEPWNYGDDALKNFKKYDSIRYRLVPYIYSHAHEMYQTGMPLMRAMVLEYQNDPNVYDIGDQYMFGENMMICPVTTKGAKTRTVYLPEGTWYNYWTGEQYKGKQYLNVVSPLFEMPIFVKGGAIIPMQEKVNYIGENQSHTYTLDIFPHGNSQFQLYEDDGTSLKYKEGNYATTSIECNKNSQQTQVTINAPEGKYEVEPRNYVVKMHRSEAPQTVMAQNNSLEQVSAKQSMEEGENSGWYYDEEASVLWVSPGTNYKKTTEIVVR